MHVDGDAAVVASGPMASVAGMMLKCPSTSGCPVSPRTIIVMLIAVVMIAARMRREKSADWCERRTSPHHETPQPL